MLQRTSSPGLVPREERVKTLLPARVRSETGWSDACILNISSRGLLLYSTCGASPGAFVELRRGNHLVVARVVWRKNGRMGLWSPEKVNIQGIISDQVAAAAGRSSGSAAERRRIPRTEQQNRERAKAMEFLATVLIASSLAVCAVFYVHEVMAKPLSAVRAALGSG